MNVLLGHMRIILDAVQKERGEGTSEPSQSQSQMVAAQPKSVKDVKQLNAWTWDPQKKRCQRIINEK